MNGDDDTTKGQVERYRLLVLSYEKLDKEIDELIMSYGGGTEKMPPEALAHYRDLARQRTDVQNDILWLEQRLMGDEEEDPGE